jgi:hypothetical protein
MFSDLVQGIGQSDTVRKEFEQFVVCGLIGSLVHDAPQT